MQNALWYVIGLVAVVAVGGFVYTQMRGPVSDMAPTTPQVAQEQSLRELMAANTPTKCTFTSAQNTQGTVYVANGKVRGDFSASVNGSAMMGHMIVMDNMSYVWMDGMSQGYKNSFEANSTSSAQANTNTQGLNPDERVSYSCEGWSVDEQMFALPSGISFMAISDTQVQGGAGAIGASCSQCNMIPDATARQQCLAALKCQ